MMRTSSTGNRAFTVVEVMVVIAVIGVLAGLIVPRLYGAAEGARLRSAAARLLAAAQYARTFATTRRQPCRLVLDADGRRYVLARIERTPTAPARLAPMRMGIGKAEGLGKGIAFGRVRIRRRDGDASGSTEAADAIVFTPAGTADAAVVEVTDGRRVWSLLVAPHTGRAELVRGPAADVPDDRVDLDE